MNVDTFVLERRAEWRRLDDLVRRAKGHPERLGATGVLDLGALYRSAAADLALARRRFPHESVVPFLDELVGRARHAVYDTGRRRETVARFVTTGYWRRVAERPLVLAAGAALLVAPALVAAWWAVADPGSAVGFVPGPFRAVVEPQPGGDRGLPVSVQAAFASEIFTNNIQVTFVAFAGGIVAGLGTAGVVAYNGALIGVLAGLSVRAGNGPLFFELVAPHGVLELSCIAVAAAAGLRMGWAVVAPGRRRRGAVVAAESRQAVLAVLGTAPWLVVAGLVEGFVTPSGIGTGVAVAVGLALGAVYWALLIWRGFLGVRGVRGVRGGPAP